MTEIEILRRLDHPNIVKLHEVYNDQKEISLILELVQGETLNYELKKYFKGFSEEQSFVIIE
jgi:serine/threonine protein kinase